VIFCYFGVMVFGGEVSLLLSSLIGVIIDSFCVLLGFFSCFPIVEKE